MGVASSSSSVIKFLERPLASKKVSFSSLSDSRIGVFGVDVAKYESKKQLAFFSK